MRVAGHKGCHGHEESHELYDPIGPDLQFLHHSVVIILNIYTSFARRIAYTNEMNRAMDDKE